MFRCILTLSFFLFIGQAASETIPLEQIHGIYMLPVRINGLITIPFILDTGASEIAIPADVFMTLRRTKTVNDSDFIGTGTFVTAEGSQHKSERFVLRELKVGDHVVKDVIANVVPTEGEPLLGQSFLSRLSSWSVDNNSHVLHLGDGEASNNNPVETSPSPSPNSNDSIGGTPRVTDTPQAFPANSVRFRRTNCGSVTDATTGLEWYVGPDNDLSWAEAGVWTHELSACGKRWGMPTIAHLRTLFDPGVTAGTGYLTAGKHWPAHIDPVFSDIGQGSWVWAQGTVASGNAPAFNFNQGVAVKVSADHFYGTIRAFAVTSRN